MKIKLANVRLAFPALFEAKTVNGEGEPAFSASFLFADADPSVETIVDGKAKVIKLSEAMRSVAQDKWGAKTDSVWKEMKSKDRLCIHDGDAKADYAGFDGMHYISARNKTRPLVIDRDKTPLAAQDGKPYGGCYVNASLELWAQDNKYGKRINASLRGVQFLKDGEAFSGGGAASDDEFDDIAEGATADDLV